MHEPPKSSYFGIHFAGFYYQKVFLKFRTNFVHLFRLTIGDYWPMKTIYTLLLAIFISTAAFASADLFDDLLMKDPIVKEFVVYPNPTSGDLTVQIESLNNSSTLTLRVFSIIGQEMMKQTVNPFNGSKKIELDLHKLPKGIYMIEISNGKDAITKRISRI